MVTYYIYHIIDEKVGCTIDLSHRSENFESLNGEDSRYNKEIEILEKVVRELDDEESWQVAGDRERWWQTKFGYSHDNIHYRSARLGLIKAGEVGGKNGGRIGGLIGGPIGGKMTGAKLQELGHGLFGMTEEALQRARSNGGKQLARMGMTPFQRRVKCPYCPKEGNLANMVRWHFDNCKAHCP
jgi:hypothetical protein